ncbi:MAG: SslE/AcfD family lipoprotein zinc metalloprotease [Aeromonas sobria]
MKEWLSVLCVASLLLTACGGDDNVTQGGTGPDSGEDLTPILPSEPIPGDPASPGEGPEPVPIPTPEPLIVGGLSFAGMPLHGEVVCAGELLDMKGKFTYQAGDTVVCTFGNIPLLSAQTGDPLSQRAGSEGAITVFDVSQEPLLDSAQKRQGAGALLSSIDAIPGDQSLTLLAAYSAQIAPLYGKSFDDADVQAYLAGTHEENTDNVDKAPSSHVDATLVPEVSQGTTNDLTRPGAFVSANAESTYRYVPAEQEVATSRLTDTQGRSLAGVAYFTPTSRGVTDAEGMMSHLWGEPITLGIGTFVFGELRGNQPELALSDVSDNEVVKQNIQSLVERYGTTNGSGVAFSRRVQEVFDQYPNAINDIINLTLPNGARLEGTEYTSPDEFGAQFEDGLAALIDAELYQSSVFRFYDTKVIGGRSAVRDDLAALYAGVDTFHIFHSIGSFYGASGYARLMRNLAISNRAIPLLMPRHDRNFWLTAGDEQVWDSKGAPYLLDSSLLGQTRANTLSRPPLVSADNMTFNLPGITAGLIGKGKVVFMGNVMYPSVLSCPDSFWAAKQLKIVSGECRYSDATNGSDPTASPMYDNGSMARYMRNLLTWLNKDYQHGAAPVRVGTNITSALKFEQGHQGGNLNGLMYPFFVDPRFNVSLENLASGGYRALDPSSIPVLILQSYEVAGFSNGAETKTLSDTMRPRLTAPDVDALISYVSQGGNIIFMDAIEEVNPEPIAKLADSAGVALGGQNVGQGLTRQAFCGTSYYCQGQGLVRPNARATTQQDLVVYEFIPQEQLGSDYVSMGQDGTLTWHKVPSVRVASYEMEVQNRDGSVTKVTKDAFIPVADDGAKRDAIAQLQEAFPHAKVCSDEYQYEVGCIEVRSGHGVASAGAYHRPNFTRYAINGDVLDAMLKAANVGNNATKLFEHERYYRSKGKQGVRLSATELQQTYDNFSVWMWNDEPYRYEDGIADELGFKTAVEYLNCYTNDQHGGNSACSAELKSQLIANNMLHPNGELNPSYPLNYQEKPLTRIMLGRAYWDLDIKVDTRGYPGRPQGTASSASKVISTYRNPVSGLVGNMQSTGLWAPQHGSVTVSGGVPATITVALVDDLTGRDPHETVLKRPPRLTKRFSHNGSSTSFSVPFGGLIYVSPAPGDAPGATADFTFNGVMKASFWQNGRWEHPINTDVPLAEIDSGQVVYTTPVNNVTNADIGDFVMKMNAFADGVSDFYGRDGVEGSGAHRRFTGSELPGHGHRFVNDIQISIGAAHSGYPVQSASYRPASTTLPTKPDNDWLLWHEIGHNLAAAPLTMPGGAEVSNNILALYMQEQRTAPMDRMDRIALDIQKMPLLFGRHGGHVWSEGDAGVRLVMFGQLKLWAERYFSLEDWYSSDEDMPGVFGDDQGWNMFKLMHRKVRGDGIGDKGKNYCSNADTGLTDGDLLMVCASYLSGTDLSDFFGLWNPGEVKTVYPGGDVAYTGGLSAKGQSVLSELGLSKPDVSPADITNVSWGRALQ